MSPFLLAFIPIFVAIDPFGIVPMFLSLTHGMPKPAVRKLVWQAVGTALFIGLTFGFAGHWILQILGIAASDFQIAGGILLLIFSMKEIFGTSVRRAEGKISDPIIGVVPLGVPIIAGPAVMTTLLIQHDLHPYSLIATALILNLMITGLIFIYANEIAKFAGEAASRAITKITSIFLAAIGIMMIRKGILAAFF